MLPSFYSSGRRLLRYTGPVHQEMVLSLMDRANAICNVENNRLGHRLRNILIETLQNICRHQIRPDHPALVSIRWRKNRIEIIAGNSIRTGDVGLIKRYIDQLNQSSGKDLKQLFCSRLKAAANHAASPGLGLIDMARRSGHTIAYAFRQQTDRQYFFLKVIVK